jgi:hypothetical protein
MNCTTQIALFIGTASLLLLSACTKSHSKSAPSSDQDLIKQANAYFDESILPLSDYPNPDNYRACQPRSVTWALATVYHTTKGDLVVSPVLYRNNLFLTSNTSPSLAYSLNSLTTLAVIRDTSNLFRTAVVTFIPDSAVSNGSPTGTFFVEDWQGNSLATPFHLSPQAKSVPGISQNQQTKQAAYVQNVQVCNEIDGYNYSPDDPSGGVAWSETSCTTYSLVVPQSGPGISAPILANPLGTNYVPFQIVLDPPRTIIANIAAYFQCFTNGSAPDHTYSVQVCVDQPQPGTRDPWGLTPGGIGGSSAAGNVVNTGHTFLILTENNQGTIITRNVGFYPSGMVVPTTTGASSQGVLGDDETHTYNVSLTINVSSTQFFSILNYVALGNNPGFYYNLNTDNCSTFAINAMAAGGITLPSTHGTWPGGSGDDPGDLGQDILGMSMAPTMSLSTTQISHPNIGTCN